jgi:hypothetical protein
MQNSIILHLVICFCLSFTKFIQNLITYLFSNYEAKFNFNSVTSLLNYFLFT